MDTVIKTINGELFEKMLTVAAMNLQASVKDINDLNVFPVPDGDTGTNMYATLAGGVELLHKKSENDIESKASALAEGMLLNARGNSGVILSQLFYGISQGLMGIKVATIPEFCSALQKGVEYAYKSVLKPVEGTILTVAREAVENVCKEMSAEDTLEKFFLSYFRELKISLNHTPELLEVLKESNVVDSGGAGLVCIAEGFCKAISGNDVEIEIASAVTNDTPVDFAFDENSVMNYGYCTELLVQLLNERQGVERFDLEEFRKFLSTVGDSIVAVRTGSKVKVHVHTMTPAVVISECQKYGEFISVKIENMTVQHNNLIVGDKEKAKKVKCAIVAVASGEGFAELYKEMGVDYIVCGGQTDNPSTEDFIKGFEEVNAENIIVLPSNKNIVLAAKQAGDLYKDATVIVVSAKTPQEVYSAMAVVADKNDVDLTVDSMNEAIANVQSCSITYAVRDAHISGVEIKKNDYMAFCNGNILLDDPDKIDCFRRMIESIDDIVDKEIITVFYGKGVLDEEKEAVAEIIESLCPDAELIEYNGEQEVYPFLVAIE